MAEQSQQVNNSAESDDPVTPAWHKWLRQAGQLIVNTGYAFSVDDCFTMAAALAYFAVLSALPLILILIALAPRIIGLFAPGYDVNAELLNLINRTFAPEVAHWVAGALPALEQETALLGGIGFLTLLWSASNVFRQLDVSVNTIWDAYENSTSTGVRQAARNFVWGRLRSFLIILIVTALFVVASLFGLLLVLVRRQAVQLPFNEAVDTLLGVLGYVLGQRSDSLPLNASWAGWVLAVLTSLVSLGLGILAMALIYRYLPPIRVPWRAVWPGAILAGLLNALASTVVSLTFSGLLAGLYQAAGGPIALMVWAYLIGQSLFLGCQLSRQYWLMFCTPEGANDVN